MSDLNISLHPRQTEAFLSPATEILYGGAAGGGKSHLMRAKAIALAVAIGGIQIYIFRRTSPDLKKNHLEGPSGLLSMLHPLIKQGWVKYNGSENKFTFWNGAIIWLCHCQHEKDRFNYQGAEIHVLMMDELTHFTEVIYRFLRGRVRLGGLQVPDSYQGRLPLVLGGSNPGNIGHVWVKKAWIDNALPMQIKRMPKSEGGMLRQYIPAKLNDNPTLLETDPDYADRLAGLGSDTLVKAMLDGSWDIVDGAFFDEFKRDVHVIKPFSVPVNWTRLIAMDWGYAKPFAILWIAVSDGTMRMSDGNYFPKDALIVYREWYGCKEGEPDVGLRMTPKEVAKGIKERALGERYRHMVADPAMWGTQTGVSVAEDMLKEGVKFYKADNSRQAGWIQIHARLKGDPSDDDTRPLLYFFESCKAIIRTLPALMHDEHKPEDVDTTMEDHAPDALRYACMARPRAGLPASVSS